MVKLFLGILTLFFLVALVIILVNRSHTGYDEMQVALQAKGYRYAFWSVLLSNFISLGGQLVGMISARWALISPVISIWLGLVVYTCYAISKGAYLPFKTKVSLGEIGLVWFGPGLISFGLACFDWLSAKQVAVVLDVYLLLAGLFMLLVAFALTVSLKKKRVSD